jgi:hypothetical protein
MKKIFSIFLLILANLFFAGTNSMIWAGEQWTSDPETGCQIAWVSDISTLVRASWTGPVVNGKAQGQGALTLVVRDKSG